MKNNILFTVIILGMIGLYSIHVYNPITEQQPIKVDVTEELINEKVNHAVDSVLKAVSKTDGQIIDMYLEQQRYILEIEKQVTSLEIELRNLRNSQ